jgi:hypothetical protein
MYKKPLIKKSVELDCMIKDKKIVTDAWSRSWSRSWHKTGGWSKHYYVV